MYISFLRSATGSIDIVPTIVTEELWVAISLVSASLPLIISDMGKFSTLGMQLGTASMNNSSNKSGTREQLPPPAPLPEYDEYEEEENESAIVLRPLHDRGRVSSTVLSPGTSQSGCTTESKRGILRKVSFGSSSWHTGGEAG